MKNGFLVFLASLIALGGSWCGFVLLPVLQLGSQKQTTVLNASELYPVGRPGMANQGLQVYRANGCAACHTEQVRYHGQQIRIEGGPSHLDIETFGDELGRRSERQHAKVHPICRTRFGLGRGYHPGSASGQLRGLPAGAESSQLAV